MGTDRKQRKSVFEECPKIKNKQIPAHKPARTNPLLTTLTRGTSDGEEKLLQREPSPNRDGQPALPGESPQHPRFSCEMTEVGDRHHHYAFVSLFVPSAPIAFSLLAYTFSNEPLSRNTLRVLCMFVIIPHSWVTWVARKCDRCQV